MILNHSQLQFTSPFGLCCLCLPHRGCSSIGTIPYSIPHQYKLQTNGGHLPKNYPPKIICKRIYDVTFITVPINMISVLTMVAFFLLSLSPIVKATTAPTKKPIL